MKYDNTHDCSWILYRQRILPLIFKLRPLNTNKFQVNIRALAHFNSMQRIYVQIGVIPGVSIPSRSFPWQDSSLRRGFPWSDGMASPQIETGKSRHEQNAEAYDHNRERFLYPLGHTNILAPYGALDLPRGRTERYDSCTMS